MKIKPRFSLQMLFVAVALISLVCLIFRPASTLDQQLIIACFRLDIDAVVRCLRAGANVNATYGYHDPNDGVFADRWEGSVHFDSEWTPLMAVASANEYPDPPKDFKGRSEEPERYERLKQDIDKSVIERRRAAEHTILMILLSRNPKIDRDDGYGATALYIAVNNDKPLLVKELLNFGANPNTRTHRYIDGPDNLTPLHAAWRSKEIFQLLLDHGADRSAKDSEGAVPAEPYQWR